MDEVVQGLLIVGERRVLLGFRASHKRTYPHFWDLFGGHVEPGEGLEEALVRELREELDIAVTRFRPAAPAMVDPNPAANGQKTYHSYLIEAWTGHVTNASDEHTKIAWFPVEEALALEALTDPARHALEAWCVDASGRQTHRGA
ncbi:NUDIX hydrolase [Microvirga puerhi]|uniref:NUDIX hydrolase n=1 Tax=Microvirga puerhi TaxID=2876078 RepID=A0ABS7VRM1_9HYPH|nr:NUDIX hydrolase [Microvirga puerhi]MBZ6078185.1 NUDIX hydrolase [Microvirga puerhi]